MNLNRKQARKRDKKYLRQLYYLKSFLALLQAYRVHLSLCNVATHPKHKSIERWRYLSVVRHRRRQFRVSCTKFYQSLAARRRSEVVYYFYEFRLSLTTFITSPGFYFVELSRPTFSYRICFASSSTLSLMRNSLIVHDMDSSSSSNTSISAHSTDASSSLLRSVGQMLMNWFMQSLQSASSTLTTSLNENDQNVLAHQFCNNLLTVGVIRKLDEVTTTTTTAQESPFKVSAWSR